MTFFLRPWPLVTLSTLFSVGLGSLVSIVPQAQAQCPNTLKTSIPRLFETPALARSYWGVTVATESGTVLYDHQGDRFFMPASVQKLFTTAAALQTLGPDYRRETTVTLRPNPANPDRPDLHITGQGDPAFNHDDLARLAQATAQQLQLQGTSVIAQLWGDEGFSQGTQTPPTWEWADTQAGFGAPVNSLVLTQNALPITLRPQAIGQPLRLEWDNPRDGVGWDGLGWEVVNRSRSGGSGEREWVAIGQSLSDRTVQVQGVLQAGAAAEPVAIAALAPGDRFLAEFAAALDREGITVQDWAVEDWANPNSPQPDSPPSDSTSNPANPAPLAVYPSPPLSDLITTTNQTSNNLYAEALVQWLGHAEADSSPADRRSPWERGLEHMESTLLELGVPAETLVIADGSGLSRQNLVTPQATVSLLQAMARSPHNTTYRQSLAVAGQQGSLRLRFQETNLVGRFQGKTGSMTGVYGLAGYVQPPQFEPLVFSAFINHANAPYGTLRQTLEAIVVELGRLQVCTSTGSPL